MQIASILLCVAMLLSGCASPEIQHKDGRRTVRDYSLSNLVKTDVDMVAELAEREVTKTLRGIAEKLYRRNPQEYRKAGLASVELAVARLFEPAETAAAGGRSAPDWQQGFSRAFREDFAGDRVACFMVALRTMLMAAYEDKTSFYVTDRLSAQKLYNSARNIEVAVWKLNHARWADGSPVLLTNSIDADLQNLSFEREFGKLIAYQDMLALIIEDQGSRTVNRVMQNAAAFVFLPI